MRQRPLLYALLTFALLLGLTQTLTYQQYRLEKEKEHEALLRELNIVKTRFLNLLYNDIAAANTLAIIAKEYSRENLNSKEYSLSNFDSIAKQILNRSKYGEAIQVTWEGVIKNVYPLKGYESTIGIDTRKDSLRRVEETRALEKGDIFFAGPRKLRQGGTGILGKVPVMINGRLKGVVVILTKIDIIKNALHIEGTGNEFAYMLNKNTGVDTLSYQLSKTEFQTGTEITSAQISEGDWTLKVGYSTLHKAASFPFALSLLGGLVALFGAFTIYRKAKEPDILNKIIKSKTRELSESELKFRSLVEKSLVGVYIAQDGKYVYVNPKFEEILEYAPGEMMGMDYTKIIHPDDLIIAKEKVRLREEKKETSVHYEIRCITKSGRIINVDLYGSMTSYEDRPALIGTLLDITEQKKTQTELIESEEKYRNVFENAIEGMYRTSMTGECLMANPALAKIFGYSSAQEYINAIDDATHQAWVNPEDRATYISLLKANHTVKGFEALTRKKDGTVIWVSMNAKIVKDDSGNFIYNEGFVIDINEKKRAEERLKQSEEKFKDLVEKARMGVYITQNDKYVYINPAFENITGYSESEIINSMSVADLIIPEDMHVVAEMAKQRREGQAPHVHYEVRGRKKDGTIRWVEIFGSITYYQGAPAMIGTFTDITERKQSTDLIIKERDLSDSIVNTLPGIFYMADLEGNFVRWNKNVEILSGKNATEISKMKTVGLVGKHNEELLIAKRHEMFLAGRATTEMTLKTVWGDERQFYFTVVKKEEGGKIYSMGIGSDITEQKQAQAALKKTTYDIGERVKELRCLYSLSEMSNNPGNSLEMILAGCANIIPPAYQYPDITCSRITFHEKVFTSPGFREGNWKQEAPILMNKEVTGKVEVFYTKQMPEDHEGPFLKEERNLINSIADILGTTAEKKLATDTLKESEEKYRYLFDNNPAIIIIWDVETMQIMEVNRIAIDLYGYTREEFIGMSILKYRPEKDHGAILDFAGYLKGDSPSQIRKIWRHLKKSGELMYMDVSSHKMTFNGRKAILSLAKDVTEQYIAEEKLKSSYEDIKRLNKHLNTVREEERAFIAREIHDELGQQLTGLKMDASWIAKKLPEGNDFVLNKTQQVISALDNTIITVRKIASDLRPGILDDLGLVAALEWQSKEFEKRSGITCNFLSDFGSVEPEKDITTTVFRIYQESLTNVMRHSGATAVKAHIYSDEKQIVMKIEDNGKGFAVNPDKKRKTLGLVGMNERAAMFGGKLEIESEPGQGTKVKLITPLKTTE